MSNRRKAPGIAGMGNAEMHAAMVGKRTSGAAGIHSDARDRRARTRSAAKRRAIREDGGA